MNTFELSEGLQEFRGTDSWYRHTIGFGLIYTDGVKFFAENAGGGAYWLLDTVGIYVFPLLRDHGFISVTVDVEAGKATIYADDGNDNVIWSEKLEYTSLPDGEWKFFLNHNTLMLPGEY